MKKLNILKYLERKDKWYLGGGNRLIWTPPFPVWLDYPGFWDKAHYYNYEIEPVFTWTILDEDGVEIPLRGEERKWDPSKLVMELSAESIEHRAECKAQRTKYKQQSTNSYERGALSVEESKCCLPNDVLTSVISIKNNSKNSRKLHLIAWTVQPNYPSNKTSRLSDINVGSNHILFRKHLHRDNAPVLPVDCVFGINRKIKSYSVNLSEGSAIQPYWRLTPFAEKFRNDRLPNEKKLSGINKDGLVFMALHRSIELRDESRESVAVFFAAAPGRAEASKNYSTASKLKDPLKTSGINWTDYFASLPYFRCSDEYLTRYYWYRWYGLKLMTMHGKEGNYKHPSVCEGIGYFRAPISYSAMCHMLENRWRRDPNLAQGSLLTFIDNQRKDGGFRGYIDMNYYRQEMLVVSIVEPFYHANWGNAVRELYRIHPDKEFLKKAYDGLVKYVRYFDRERDPERSGLYDIDNHYETGQEYMHRYLAVDPGADKDNWGRVFRLKGVDVTVYIYELKKTLSWMAEVLKRKGLPAYGARQTRSTDTIGRADDGLVQAGAESAKWRRDAVKIKQAILEKMWDPKEEMFFDINPKTGKRTKVKAAVCFYPYMTDIVSEKHLQGLKKHLLNPGEFRTKYPVPSSSADDKYFSSESEWKGKRMNCPWNGRVWPMTNSHMAEVLAQCAIRFKSKELRAMSGEFIYEYIRMMFFNNDPGRPNCFEHYNPISGEPSVYRGVDDYQHSWIVDLLIKYLAGVRPEERQIVVDPFPFQADYFTLDNLFICGRKLTIVKRSRRVTVWINGKKYGTSTTGKCVEAPL